MYEPLWSTEKFLSAVAEAVAAVAAAGMLLTTPGKDRTGGHPADQVRPGSPNA